jgi:DNA repair protein RecN (Recombination protein N)
MQPPFYLKQLIIQNFATFKNQTIHFHAGLNSIVGETGSGKSLVLDALQLIFGARADKKIIRKNCDFALIEASFNCQDKDVKKFLQEIGHPIDSEELIIKRIIISNGTTKNYINHLSANLGILAEFSKKFIDLVGQFENQKLLSSLYQLQLLDQYGEIQKELTDYKEKYSELKNLEKELIQLQQTKTSRDHRLDYLQYQIDEIQILAPSSQDEIELLEKKSIMINLERNQRLNSSIDDIFIGGESSTGLLNQLKSLQSIFFKNSDLFKNDLSKLSHLDDLLNEIYESYKKKLNTELDPHELEGVIERLDQYSKLKKKFGGTVLSILDSLELFLQEREKLQTVEISLKETEGKIIYLKPILELKAEKLHQKRLHFAKKLSQSLTEKVRNLKMAGATIKMVIEKSPEIYENGCSKIEFIAETNPGEGFFRVKDIASGGELSRILLGLRQILACHDSISIFLFDEIDTGIGGETATSLGRALQEVAKNGQVIAITHLPQVAQFSDSLILVEKDIQESSKEIRTESRAQEFTGKMIKSKVLSMAQLS